jgi:hypothetical protein
MSYKTDCVVLMVKTNFTRPFNNTNGILNIQKCMWLQHVYIRYQQDCLLQNHFWFITFNNKTPIFVKCTTCVVSIVTIAMIDVLLNRESNYRSNMTHGNKIDEQKTKVKKVYANYISLEDVTCV